MTETPTPPVPADCDLRDFAFMPLDVARLRDSDFAAIASGEEFRAAVLLWCASWHQVPAASLPSDERALSLLAGYGRDLRGWAKVRAAAMHGWYLASDGRMYHPVVAEKAQEAWDRRNHERERKASWRRGRNGDKDGDRDGDTSVRSRQSPALRDSGQGERQGEAAAVPPLEREPPPPLDLAHDPSTEGWDPVHAGRIVRCSGVRASAPLVEEWTGRWRVAGIASYAEAAEFMDWARVMFRGQSAADDPRAPRLTLPSHADRFVPLWQASQHRAAWVEWRDQQAQGERA